MRILVAGGGGMIGSNIVRLLDGQAFTADLRATRHDLRDTFTCETVARNMDVIYDCAAPTRGIGSHDFSDVARIPLNLLAQRPKHFVYASSSCVYPDNATIPTPEFEGFDAEPEAANRGYGWGKRVGELACRYSGVACTIVRPSNVYGPSYDWSNPVKHVIPSLIEKMLTGRDLTVWGSGEQTRSFLYEEDCARLMIALSRHTGIFNMPGEEITVRELVTKLANIMCFQGEIHFDTSRPEGPKRKLQDDTKLVSVLPNWEPQVSLDEGLRRTIEAASDAYRNHQLSQSAHRA